MDRRKVMERIKVGLNFIVDDNLEKSMLDEFYNYPKAVEYIKKLGIT
jgi:hypothetical protein